MRNTVFRLRKIILLLLAALCLAGTASALDFPDVDEGDWAFEAIAYWTEKGTVNGYPDGNFYPVKDISREEVAVLIARLRGIEPVLDTALPSDVSASHYAAPSILACMERGIFTGYDDGTFRPGEPITRQEAMAVLYRMSRYSAKTVDAVLDEAEDSGDVGLWAREAVGTLMAEGVVTGYPDGTIRPLDNISRAEFVSILYRIERADMWGEDKKPVGTIGEIGYALENPGVRVTLATISEKDYLFLPASADLTALHLDFDRVEGATVTYTGDIAAATESEEETFDVTSVAAPDAQGAYCVTVCMENEIMKRQRTVYIMKSENLKSIFVTSDDPEEYGRSYVEAVKGNSATGGMVVLDADGEVVYDNVLPQIKSRGNSTFSYVKKSYQIKLDKKTDLLGNGEKVKTWVLLAAYVDATMVHDKACKDLAANLGLPGSPDCMWVDLYYDGEYRGTYLLSEKIQIAGTGLDIFDLEGAYEDVNPEYGENVETGQGFNRYGNTVQYVAGLRDPESITAGYLIELNSTAADENSWFKTSQKVAFNIKSPENVTLDAARYISEYYQDFEDAVYAKDLAGNATGINPRTGKAYYEYCDLQSLVALYLIYEFSCNNDAYLTSVYFYKTEDTMYCGPIWDSELAFGIGWWGTHKPSEDYFVDKYLIQALTQIPSFRDAVKAYYEETFRDQAALMISQYVPGYASVLTASERMNHILWPEYYICGDLSVKNKTFPEGTTYWDVMEELYEWMNLRLLFMDRKFAAWGANTDGTETGEPGGDGLEEPAGDVPEAPGIDDSEETGGERSEEIDQDASQKSDGAGLAEYNGTFYEEFEKNDYTS